MDPIPVVLADLLVGIRVCRSVARMQRDEYSKGNHKHRQG